MPKTTTIGKYDVDISSVLEKVQKVKDSMKQGTDLGISVPKSLLKDLDQLEAKLEKLQKSKPQKNASSKELGKFNSALQPIDAEIDDIVSKMSKIKFSDEAIKENIASLQELVKNYNEAKKAYDEYSEKIADPNNGVKAVKKDGPYREQMEKTRSAAIKIAQETGSAEEIKAKFASMRETLSQRKKVVSGWSDESPTKQSQLEGISQRQTELKSLEQSILRYNENLQRRRKLEEELSKELEKQVDLKQQELQAGVSKQIENLSSSKQDIQQITNQVLELQKQASAAEEKQAKVLQIKDRIKQLFSFTSVLYTAQRAIRSAIRDFQELDKQFNEIAIVSDYTTQELWNNFNVVNKTAQDFGVTTKDVLEVQNLYYHQGKSIAQVNKLTAQTLTLAKITGMDYADATNKLTAALNAYKMSAQEAIKVTDTVSALAANAATDSKELMTALTKTASIAANAGMSLESTEVFLTKMIETTREAPENLGTALKTIVARFGEVKQEIDGEEIELADINKVDTALKTAGVSLLDTAGQIRNLDDVFMELSSKWDSLDRNTQRYIATIAAGSRQQSRFIAMMENYDRTLELTEVAQNSNGTSARQLAKAQESIETSLNRLRSSWQEFYSSIISAQGIKVLIDTANNFLSLLNELPAGLNVVAGALGIWAIKTLIVDKALNSFGQSIGTGMAKTSGMVGPMEALLSTLDKETLELLATNEALDENTKKRIANALAIKEQANAEDAVIAKNAKTGEKTNIKVKKKVEDAIDTAQDNSRKKNDLGIASSFKDNKDSIIKNFNEKTNGIKLSGKNKTKGGMKTLFTNGLKGIKTKLIKGISGIGTKIAAVIGKIVGGLKAVVSFLGGPLTAVIAIVTGAVIAGVLAWKKWGAASLDDTKQVEKLNKAQENYNKTLKDTKDLKQKTKKYLEYESKANLTTEQQQEQQEIAKELVETYPELLKNIDEEGNYYLKDAAAINKVIEAKEKLLDQESENYTKLRLDYQKQGIYADTTTEAGRAMQSIQEYTSALDEDTIAESAKKIDDGTTFNSSKYKKIMQAYSEGKKYSFDEKDFSNLFEGSINEKQWNEFLKIVEREEKNGNDVFATIGTLENALKETGAYSKGDLKDVAEAFMKMNEENGHLFSQLITGASKEYSQIEINQATVTIDKGNFATDLGSELKAAISTQAVKNAKKQAADEENWKPDEIDKEWQKLDEEKKTDYINDAAAELSSIFEEFTKEQIQAYNQTFTSENLGSIKLTDLEKLDITKIEDTDIKGQKEAILTFWDQFPEEIKRNFPRDYIDEASEDVIQTLFTLIANAIEENPADIRNKIQADFEKSKALYENQNAFSFDTGKFSELTIDQYKALSSKIGSLSLEEVAPFLNELNAQMAEIDPEKASDFFNTFVKQDFSSETGIINAIQALSKFGYTAQQVTQMGVNASNGINNISFSDFNTTVENSKKELENLEKGFDNVIALMEGTASIDQFGNYLDTMMTAWTELYGAEKASNMVMDLSNSVVATGDGFKIGAEAGTEYANSLVDITKQTIISQIALEQLKLTQEGLTEEERASSNLKIAYLNQYYAFIDAKQKTTIRKGLEKDLEDTKNKADKLRDSLKELVNWLREYDRYANLDRVIQDYDEKFGHLEYEIEFSTNEDVIKENIRSQIDNLNNQIAANQGGIRAAKEEQEMWQDVINKRNAAYVEFDEAGNAIVNAKELRRLQEEIANADEEQQEVLKAEYDEIMNNVEAYNKAKDKVEDYNKALEENFKALEEYLKANYEAITKVEDKLIEARQTAEDKELEIIKNKYDAIKEENDKYLENIQEMVDKEREIRDRADREQDVKDKEKKLAMMKMDTSGIYASDIRALEEELEDDYQDLEDDAIDKAIEDLEKEYQTQAEILDKEVEYLESSLEYRREIMTEYNQWAQEMMMQGSDTVIEYLKANDEEYYTGTAAAQANWTLEWNNAVAQGVAANNVMATTLEPVIRNLETCKDNANGFEGAVKQYSEVALASNGEIEGSVEDLTTYYYSLAEGVGDVASKMNDLRQAYIGAASAAAALKSVQSGTVYGSTPPQGAIDDAMNNLNGRGALNYSNVEPNYVDTDGNPIGNDKTAERSGAMVWNPSGWKVIKEDTKNSPSGQWYRIEQIRGNGWGYVLSTDIEYDRSIGREVPKPWAKIRRFAKGGYVNFTGPAWVDGTKSHPEYMLNATQTAQFETLVAALNNLYGNGISSLKQSAQKIGDAYYNFHINVEQIANDYDVDQLVSRLEQKMVDSSKYRNITLLKKSQ